MHMKNLYLFLVYQHHSPYCTVIYAHRLLPLSNISILEHLNLYNNIKI